MSKEARGRLEAEHFKELERITVNMAENYEKQFAPQPDEPQ